VSVPTWQDQARAFLGADSVGACPYRTVVLGAIAGRLGSMAVQHVMGGPRTESTDRMFDRFAIGCRAFLAAYEAERE
jgi:hypothetical protein